MTASVVSLVINVLISPILTRIYSAEEIGDVNLYTRIVVFISTIATVRYELSLPIAKQQLHAFHLYRLTYRIALVILTAIGIVGLLYALIKPVDAYSMWFMLLVIVGAYLSVMDQHRNQLGHSHQRIQTHFTATDHCFGSIQRI